MVTIHDNSSNKQYNRSQINHLADWLTLQGECKQPQMGISHGDTMDTPKQTWGYDNEASRNLLQPQLLWGFGTSKLFTQLQEMFK